MLAFRILTPFLIALICLTAPAPQTVAQELGFLEEFVMAEDREAVLKQLVPGTEPYYYYHCLHYQNSERLEQVEAMLPAWKKRFGESNLYRQIVNRQMLLKYSDNPQETLDYLRKQLGLNFNHQRQIPQAQRNLPSRLDPKLIDTNAMLNRALSHSGLEKITDAGIRLLANKTLNRTQRKQLLQRLDRPDFPGLVQLIDAELKERDATSFGNVGVHGLLTIEQMDELARLRPRIKTESNYVNLYISKLAPSNDSAWRLDPQLHQQYLQRLWDFATTLTPSFNSLKANILYQQLDLDRQQERYNRDRFMQYLKLPRNVYYVNPTLIKNTRVRDHLVQLGQDYSRFTQLPAIRNDDSLVREYLQHFLRDANDYRAFEPYIRDSFLKQQFAETKILAGIGDVEKWASLLSPEQYKQLLERVDVEFAATNPEYFGVEEEVALSLYLKNVDNLIVKVFEINTQNFYRKFGKQIDTDITLDGLVPNDEQSYQYEVPPAIRKRQSFKFPKLNKRGVYVIDFIAGGKSSRALIRKGRLQFIDQVSAAGHLVRVIDQDAQHVKDASLWIAGRRYNANDEGLIQVPFSTQPGSTQAIITQGDFSCLQRFDHQAETYRMNAALVLDRENLTRSNKAQVLIRPSLVVAGVVPTSIKLIEKPKLVVTTVNLDGVSAQQTINDFKLEDGIETVCEFVVPPRLNSIALALSGEIKNMSTGATVQLAVNRSFKINDIDRSDQTQDFHLVPDDRGYFLEVLGKSGEARANQAVRVALNVDGFKDTVYADLQSDDNGLMELGPLANVRSLSIQPTRGQKKSWNLNRNNQTFNQTIHVATGETVEVPAPAGVAQVDRQFVSLHEIRSGQVVRDWFNQVAIRKGLVSIKDLAAGDYRLQLRSPVTSADGQFRHNILIRVSAGQRAKNVLVSPARHLELGNRQRLQVSAVGGNGQKVRIELENATRDTRVHVVASRYLPAFNAFAEMSPLSQFEPWSRQPADRRSVYMEGRKIGEEYEYILRRKYASKYPGNMLQRPSMLLNPWAVRDTQNRAQDAAKGDQFGGAGGGVGGMAGRAKGKKSGPGSTTDFANLDFLGDGSVLLVNLKPNDAGVVTIDRDKLGDGQHLRVIAANGFETVQRQIDFPTRALKPRDARLANSLDPEKHYAQSKQTDLLAAGDKILIDDLVSAKFQHYDDLSDAYTLLQSLGKHDHLAKFRFILTWPDQTDEDKQRLYSEFACHELNFFIYKKDPEFFKSVVLPHLKQKRAKTFIDHFLLGNDLEAYTRPWAFARLNMMERILLAKRLQDRRNDLIRSINESYLVTPTPRQTVDRFYDTSLFALGLDATRESLSRLDRKRSELRSKDAGLPELARQANTATDKLGAAPQSSARFAAPAPGGSGMGGGGYGGGGFGGRPSNAPTSGLSDAMVLSVEADEAEEIMLGEKLVLNGVAEKKNARGRRQLELGKMVAGAEIADFEYAEGNAQAGEWADDAKLGQLRQNLKRLYRRIDSTKEWIENNYYLRTPDQQTPQLVPINQFWRDYANHQTGPFLTPHIAESHRSFTEAMFALAVLDLPLKAPENDLQFVDNSMTFTAGGPAIVLHQQVRDAVFNRGNTKILVSENFFQKNDRYRYEEDVRYDKFVTGEFLAHTLYGGQVVITNPTSTPRAIELLIQIPQGSIACSGSQETRTLQLNLDAFSTKTYEYYFYFPTAGNFKHYPAHVAAKEQVLAVADGQGFNVVDRQAEVDRESWEFVSQNGTEDQVIDFLNSNNVLRLDLNKIAFRMKEQRFFKLAINVLRNRYVFNSTLWAYGIRHNDVKTIREYLTHDNAVTNNCGMEFNSELVTINPVERNWYGHKEYWPLVNARAHQLGPQRKILNPDFFSQYQQLLNVMANHRQLDDDDHLVMTYYLLLQDRIESALDHFAKVSPENVESRLQYDYCDAYLDFYREQPESAAQKAAVWADYPVDHWRNRFQAILAQVDEIKGGQTTVTDKDDAQQQQTELAAKSESIDLEVMGGVAKLTYQNVDAVNVNFYEMDIELLFSRNPFAQDNLDGFSLIRPNQSQTLQLKPGANGKGSQELKLPESMQNKNVLIEVVAGDQVRSQPLYAHSLNVKLTENYGQVQVSDQETGRPIAKTYIKVYARMADGSERFHKDGYTDLRGRFDYVSQSNRTTDGVQKFSILMLSEENGAIIRQANPPRE